MAAYARTCRWLLNHSKYRDWLDPSKKSHHHGFLWMRGKAGAGKSTMMKFAYLELKKRDGPNTMTASFFFNARGEDLEKSIVGMYRSLLTHLLNKFPYLQSILDDIDIIPLNQQGCPDLGALKELLRSALMGLGQRSFTCFIDALDECDEQEARDMVQCFEDLAEEATEAGIQLRICFSSRPYPYISIRKGISLTLEDESGHAQDLVQYVKSKLKIDDPVLLADLQSQILGKASGVFLWIVLTVDILNKEVDEGGLALKRKLSKIPDKLSDLFKSILMRDQKSPERLLLCVLWILCAKRPLTPAEFRHALWVGLLNQQSEQKDDLVDFDVPDVSDVNANVKLITSSSKGLAEITKSEAPTVQFIHESVRDFLVKERGFQELWPDLGFHWEALGHEKLRRYCTQYLSLAGLQPIIKRQIDKTAWDAQKYSLLEYASQKLLHHADAAALVIPQEDFLSQFSASPCIKVVSLFSWSHSIHATLLYVLADQGLANLITTRMKQDSAKQESLAYIPKEEYHYPVFAALANRHKDAVAALLGLFSVTYDVAVDIDNGFRATEYKNNTPLSWAAREGRLSIVKALAHVGADVNEKDRDGCTPLLWSSKMGHKAIARFLINSKADVDAQDANGWTALIWALRNDHEAVVRLLIDGGADVNARASIGWTALIWASRNDHEAVVRLLIDNGADIDAQDCNGLTALIRASCYGHEAVTRLLINSGADVEAQDSTTGWTALIWASCEGHEAVARLLIDNGADVKAQSKSGLTALTLASRNGHEAVVRLLIDNSG